MNKQAKINAKTLDYVEVTGKALGAALKLAETVDAEKAAAATVAKQAQDRLLSVGLIDEHEVKFASEKLGNHAEALKVLNNVVDHYEKQLKEAEAKFASASLGSGVSDKSASHDKYANYPGYRRGDSDGLSEADQALMRLVR